MRHKKQQPINDIARKIGGNIFELRIKNNLTLEELAAKCEISVSHICNIENGKAKVTAELLYKLSHIFFKPIQYFFSEPSKDA